MAWNHLARTGAFLAALAALTLPGPARASINVPSDGSDGAFNPTASVQVDLSQAVTGTWSDNNTANAGKGVYDPVKWAVVFKYSSVNIPAGVTVTFKNHPSGAPVVWLVQGDVTIAGTVNLNGNNGGGLGTPTEAGPGGYRGGGHLTSAHPVGNGHGPGGGGQPASGTYYSTAGSYGTQGVTMSGVIGPVYGNAAILPLLGGSGGTGYGSGDGGAGGGAILLCSGTTVNISSTGTLRAIGGNGGDSNTGGGSGGAIRIIADAVSGSGGLQASGGGGGLLGGSGRIRIECNGLAYTGAASPTPSNLIGLTSDPTVWPPANIPAVAITEIAGGAAPADPHAVLDSSDHYVPLDLTPTTPITVRMNATNVPVTWNVVLRVVPTYGKDFTVNATNVSGDATASVWEATITASTGVSAIQARASKP